MVVTVFAWLVWPAMFIDLAERFRWRLGLPSVTQDSFQRTLAKVQLRGEATAGEGATLLFGDSHLHGLPGSALGSRVGNFAIAGEKAAELVKRIAAYQAVRSAGRIVLLSGTNDLAAGAAPAEVAKTVAQVMEKIPQSVPVYLMEIPPSANPPGFISRARQLNLELASHCKHRPLCTFVSLNAFAGDDGQLRRELADADGIHLAAPGYELLARTIAAATANGSEGQKRPNERNFPPLQRN